MDRNKIDKGAVYALVLILGLLGVIFVSGFYGWSMNRHFLFNKRIAETKAFYNAETGMARKAFGYLWKADFIDGYSGLKGEKVNKNMGSYLSPTFSFDFQGNRIAEVYGIHELKTSNGTMYPCSALVSLPAKPQTLGVYMYLTESEEAGGAPFVFDGPGDRREVNFSSADVLEGIVQTNGQLVVSDFGCPDFENASVFLTNSTPIDLGGCSSYQEMFGGWGSDVDTASKPPVKLPPAGYETLKRVATHTIQSGTKITASPNIKDTLIMTDINFLSNGEYHVIQWWYLMPPHLKPGLNSDQLENPIGVDLDLEDYTVSGIEGEDNWSGDCENIADLRSCHAYLDYLASYHAKKVDFLGNDRLLDNTITGPSGLHHFDIDAKINPISGNIESDNIIATQTFPGSNNSVIYVKNGQVRVRGHYSGRYTIVTDEHTLYRRHAWPTHLSSAPIDTIWNNIWLTDDLINVDALGLSSGAPAYTPHGNMSTLQPEEGCMGGSENSMGLVSGANIYIANTRKNGARNNTWAEDIVINAGMIALNESFVLQYWQNSTSSMNYFDNYLGNQYTHQPPWGDARGDEFGTLTGNFDNRGYVYLWGGIVQKHRGYMTRNPQSQYGNADIGMDKSYHYDANLDCSPPPFYPVVQFDDGSGEINIKLVGYNSKL